MTGVRRGTVRSTTTRDRIEQAAARGLTPSEIVAALGVRLDTVDWVLDWMDRAHRGYPEAEKPKSVGGAPLKPCGTKAAYCRHLARGEVACDPCLAAMREYSRITSRKIAHLEQGAA